MLLDNFLRNGSGDFLPELTLENVQFFSANTTSRIQVLDADKIAFLKCRYRSMIKSQKLDFLDAAAVIYNIDQLRAMKYLKAIWTPFSSNVIQSFWENEVFFLISETGTANTVSFVDFNDTTQLDKRILKLASGRKRVSTSC